MPRKTDEQDSTTSVKLNYFMAFLVTAGIFAADILTDKGILDGTLIGILITKVWDGISKQNDYFFPGGRANKPDNNKESENNEQRTDSKL